MVLYLVVIGNIYDDECLIYTFTGKDENGTLLIFNKTLYHCCYKELRNELSPILIYTTHKNAHFKIKSMGRLPGVV